MRTHFSGSDDSLYFRSPRGRLDGQQGKTTANRQSFSSLHLIVRVSKLHYFVDFCFMGSNFGGQNSSGNYACNITVNSNLKPSKNSISHNLLQFFH
jgi:hypothetical protein